MGERTYAVPQWVVACLLAYFDGDCRPDHHGLCQAHTLDKPCPVAVLRATHTLAAACPTCGSTNPVNRLLMRHGQGRCQDAWHGGRDV